MLHRKIDDPPRYKEAREKLYALLMEYSDVLSPAKCAEHGWDADECDHPAFGDMHVRGDMMVSEWILIASWADMETSANGITVETQDNMSMSHVVGLIEMGRMYVDGAL